MLSAHNVHKNAASIKRAGADKQYLVNAVCFELASSGEQRMLNLTANQKLIARSKNLLAPINGEERYITIGCGHTTAVCKLAQLCSTTGFPGATTQKILMDDNKPGLLAAHKLEENETFKEMIHEGWGWTVVPYEVDTAFPDFAKIAQRALNTANHICTEVGELEAAVTISDVH